MFNLKSIIMKKLLVFLCSLLILTACSDNASEFLFVSGNGDECLSRGIVLPTGTVSKTNPNLISDWENQEYIVLNSLGNGTTRRSVAAPWKNGNTTSLPEEFCKNIRKEDGWTMLFHTFNAEGEDERMNYMFLYNIFTGYVKVFYYSEISNQATSARWYLKYGSLNNPTPSTVLEVPDYFAKVDSPTLNDTKDGISITNPTVSNISNISEGWNGFEYRISRYEQFPTSLPLIIGATAQIITDYNFEGTFNMETSGTITSQGSTNTPFGSAMNSVSDIGGSFATDGLKGLANSLNVRDIVGFDISNTIASIGSNAAPLILSALKLCFGHSMFTKNLYIDSDVKLSHNGTITCQGNGVTDVNAVVLPLSFNLVEIAKFQGPSLKNRNLIMNPTFYLNSLPGLGVWTLEDIPDVYYNPYTRFVPTRIAPFDGRGVYDIDGITPYPEISDWDLNVVINPYVEQYLDSWDYSIDFVESSRAEAEDEDNAPHIELSDSQQLVDSTYAIEPHHMRFVMKANLGNAKYDDKTKFYYEWPETPNRKTIAIVTVTLNINYMGKKMQLVESRAYKVRSHIDEGAQNPMGSATDGTYTKLFLNAYSPRVESTNFEKSVPPYMSFD